MESYDVAIVGAGLAGLQCARLLARRGAKVVLIDRKQRLSERVHTTGIFVRRTLEDFDIPEACLGPAIRDVDLYSPSARRLNLSSDRTEYRIGRMGPLYERWLDAAIEVGADWRPKSNFLGCERRAIGDIQLRLEQDGDTTTIHCRFLIAADGAASRVASQLGLSENTDWIVGFESIYSIGELKRSPKLHCFLDPHLAPGYLAWIAEDGEEAHVGVGGYADRFQPKEALDGFIETTAKTVLDFSRREPVEQRGGRIPVGGLLPKIVNPFGMLVGDASGAVSPLTAGGLDPCMRLSALAAQVTWRYLETNDVSALDDYQANRFRRRFRKRRFLRRMITSIRSRRAAEAAFLALQTPLFRGVASKVFFGRGSFPIERRELAPILDTHGLAPRTERG